MRKLLLSFILSLLLVVGLPTVTRAACDPTNPNSCGFGQFCNTNTPNGIPTCQTSEPQGSQSSWTAPACTVDGKGEIATLQGFGCIFRNVLQLIVPLLGLALFVLLLVGGFQYMTAGGDPKQTQKASGTITTTIIGIVVIVGVWFIFKILGALTGLNLLNFVIPG